MSWYALKDLEDIHGNNDSLVVAYANLLKRFKRDIDPISLGKVLADKGIDLDQSWGEITKYDASIISIPESSEVVPTSRDAIIKFRCLNPKDNIEGFYYCLLADIKRNIIIDSFDGEEKFTREYGDPVDWACFTVFPSLKKNKPIKPGSIHRKVKGETIWTIATRFKISAKELMEHNDIDDPNDLPDGTDIHLPYAKEIKEVPVINYEVFDTPKIMHTVKEDGTTKWSFGNVRDWKDIQPYGPVYPKDKNFEIVAIARVPIGQDVAAYYMDTIALGNYKETGRVAYTVGFNHSHLADGYIPKDLPTPTPQQPLSKPDPTPEPEPEPIPEPKINYNEFKTTYKPFPEPKIYLAQDTIMVHDLDARGQSGTLYKDKGVLVAGTFEKDGKTYARPKPGAHGFWYGIPMEYLKSEEEVYNYSLSLPEKVAMHKPLKPNERAFWSFTKAVRKSTQLVNSISRDKHKKRSD